MKTMRVNISRARHFWQRSADVVANAPLLLADGFEARVQWAILRKNAQVTLALDDTKQGEDVVIVEGTAELLDNPEISVTCEKARSGSATTRGTRGAF